MSEDLTLLTDEQLDRRIESTVKWLSRFIIAVGKAQVQYGDNPTLPGKLLLSSNEGMVVDLQRDLAILECEAARRLGLKS